MRILMNNEKISKKGAIIFVLDKNGDPLMPTFRCGKVRRLLKDKKAKIVQLEPFTIQLLIESKTYTQKLSLGFDTGTGNIGTSVVNEKGDEIFSATFETNTQEIKGKMENRADQRQTRKRHDREKQKRRARKNNTTFEGEKELLVKGCEIPLKIKEIKSNICRFKNKVDEGKLTPTATHCLTNHQNILNKILKILPITSVIVEYAKFDIHALTNPEVKGKDYQKGALYQIGNHKAYALQRDNYTCQLCKKKKKEEKLEVHHIDYKSNGGEDHYCNFVTLHKECHHKVHNDKKIEEKLLKIVKQLGIQDGKISTRGATILNTVMSRFLDYCIEKCDDVSTTFGYITKERRYELGIGKSHNNDAYICALNGNTPSKNRVEPYFYGQYARNNRKFVYAQTQRKYTGIIDGEKVIVHNRKKALNQKTDSLEDFREKYGVAEVSKLTVLQGMRKMTSREEFLFNKGDLIKHNGKNHVVSGTSNGGKYVRLMNQGTKNFKLNELKLLEKSKGFARTNW